MGTIISSRIERRQQSYHGGVIYDYLPVFEFEYEYNGHLCQAFQHGISTSFVKSEQDAEALRLRYPVGTSVTVFVNPRNSRQACLQNGISFLTWVLLLSGILFTVASLRLSSLIINK